jgi:pimeloyl-ACP methyl ester carboxylesterase
MLLSFFRRRLPYSLQLAVVALLLVGLAPRTDAAEVVGYRAPVAPPGAPEIALHVEEQGRGAPLLLLHGLGASSYTWRHVVPALARSNRVIAIDLRGFGRSDKPFDQRYSAADQAAHIVAFIERRRLRGVTIAGHSFGGAVALLTTLELNRRAPGLVDRLVLLDAPAYPQQPTAFVRFLSQPVLPYALLSVMPPELPTAAALSTERNADGPAMKDVSAYAAPYYEAGARHALITTARLIRPANWRQIVARYPSIRQPTLIVWCDHDHVVPISSGERLAKVLPDARLRVIRGCEHSPQDEKPAELLRLLGDFLRR